MVLPPVRLSAWQRLQEAGRTWVIYWRSHEAGVSAHLATTDLMDRDQISRYQRLRGYEGADQDHGAHH